MTTVPSPAVPPGRALAALALSSCLLTACGGQEAGPTPAGSAARVAAYPVSVSNCGATVGFDSAPERVVLLKSSAVPFLHELGVMGTVIARAGQYPDEYYDDATRAELDEIPLLTDELDSSGHLRISQEVVIGQAPDLVLGEVDNLSRETLDAVGIPLLEEPALCEQAGDAPELADIYDQLELYGRVFDRPAEARAAVDRLRARVAAVEEQVGRGSGRTAAVLYPTVGGGTTYAYGTGSMADPQLRAAGFTNVFGDVDERVVEVTLEELLGRDPDVLVLLHSEGEPEPVEEALTALPGAEELTAVRNGDVMTQLFNFTEPPSPLSVDGLERIVDRFGPRP